VVTHSIILGGPASRIKLYPDAVNIVGDSITRRELVWSESGNPRPPLVVGYISLHFGAFLPCSAVSTYAINCNNRGFMRMKCLPTNQPFLL
jgi:hypothetical protein